MAERSAQTSLLVLVLGDYHVIDEPTIQASLACWLEHSAQASEVEAVIKSLLGALEQVQPEGIRYASCRLSDEVTYLVFLYPMLTIGWTTTHRQTCIDRAR